MRCHQCTLHVTFYFLCEMIQWGNKIFLTLKPALWWPEAHLAWADGAKQNGKVFQSPAVEEGAGMVTPLYWSPVTLNLSHRHVFDYHSICLSLYQFGGCFFLPCMPQIYQNWSFSVTRWLRVKESLWSKGGMRPLSRWLPWCILEWEILTVLLTLVVSLWLLGFLSVPFDWPGG